MDGLPVGFTQVNTDRQAAIPARKSSSAEAAIEFEAMMLGTMVNDMMKDTMPKTMNGGMGEEMFRSFLGNEIGRIMAETGGIGLADQIRASIEKSGGGE